MLHQHRRFLRIHAEDPFVRRYMEAIGHHEFGMNLCPVDFGGWVAGAPESTELAFWLEYWVAAYRFVLDHSGPGTILLSYGHLTERPRGALARLAEAVRAPVEPLLSQADDVHPPRLHEVADPRRSLSALDQAMEVYGRLEAAAAV